MFGSFGGSPGGTASTMLYQGHPPVNLYYRPLQQSDYDALKAIHQELFPIDYEDVFFRKAVAGEDRVFTWAAVHSEYGRDYLVGFVTARVVYLYECDPMDRQVMSLASKCLDGDGTVYVLTLGVVPACRQCGIARSLLGLVHQHASRLRCRAIFLHVISYNDAAMRLYGTSGYQVMARLPNFYHLVTGRQPNPDQSWYDAFLYALFIPSSGPELSPAMQWAGGMLGAAVAPLRSMLGTFNGCIPSWLCRQTYSTFMPLRLPLVPGVLSKMTNVGVQRARRLVPLQLLRQGSREAAAGRPTAPSCRSPRPLGAARRRVQHRRVVSPTQPLLGGSLRCRILLCSSSSGPHRRSKVCHTIRDGCNRNNCRCRPVRPPALCVRRLVRSSSSRGVTSSNIHQRSNSSSSSRDAA
ncbi:hypothetical protein Vretimale_7887 [Volvox reticuliferus]|uniref:N-alpha-acetyltransferase 60 n=1 Tax=Volvox reticuliferus TaxID=1737510 RepID=A0A8J4LML9_9CHLO|nr:hypothetical protein Vretimale_7887 [Volvox reticuliferus]